MAIEIGTDAVEDLARELVLFPFLCIERENVFAHQIDALAFQLDEVVLKEVLQALVQLKSDQLSASGGSLLCHALTTATDGFTVAGGANSRLLVDTGAVVVDMSEQEEEDDAELVIE